MLRSALAVRTCAALGAALTLGSLAVALPAQAAVAKPASFALVKGGSYNTGLRVQWKWAAKTSYEIQAATDDAFTDVVADVRIAAKSTKPAGGLMATTVKNLPNATDLHLRARSISAGGATSGWTADVDAATKVALPSKFVGKVTATPGPRSGEITFSWDQDGTYTTSYQLETGLTVFSKTDPAYPTSGRNARTYDISKDATSFTLSAAQVAEAGAPLGSATHLLFRFSAVNHGTAGEKVRRYPYLGSVMPQTVAGDAGDARIGLYGTDLRVGTFNVRTAKATDDARNWLQRVDGVAGAILAKKPDVVALQELGPGRADGASGTTDGTPRQTESLQTALAARYGDNYRLVRTTPYVKSGTVHGTQGARILYNTDELTLASDCSETTGSSKYSASCSTELPLLPGDPESARRTAAYAKFTDNTTGQAFWFVSMHLDERHDEKSLATETKLNGLRGTQVSAVLSRIAALNTAKLPVVVAGDMNSWQNNAAGHAPHDTLVAAGFTDSASAPNPINLAYPTFNGFELTQDVPGYGYGARLDGIFVRDGAPLTYENVTKKTDDARPSDHNLVVSDLEI